MAETTIAGPNLPIFPSDTLTTDACGKEAVLTTASSNDKQDSNFDQKESPVDTASREHFPPAQSTRSQVVRARLQIFAICFCLFLAGWNDGANGPLIPRMQAFYHVSYSIVSMVFVGSCIGFLIGAALNIYLNDKIGFGKVMVVGSLCQIVAYSITSPAPPFPVLVIMYALNGIGIALQDSQANAFVASVRENKAGKMGLIHSVYGFGALCAPLVSTQFSQIASRRWAFHYLASLGLSIVNTIILAVVFRGKRQEVCLRAVNQVDPAHEEHHDHGPAIGGNRFKQIMRQKVLHIIAIFSFVYMGVEVTIGGWTVSYIIEHRNGGPSSGYISSGYWGGLTLGRVALLWVNQKVGPRRVVFIYALIAIAMEIIVYVVPHLIGNAIAVSFLGFVLGPMYPILMNVAGSLIPPAFLPGSIGWTAGFGTVGAALLPFGTGALAERYGIASLQPFLIALTTFMLCLWGLIPRKRQTGLTQNNTLETNQSESGMSK